MEEGFSCDSIKNNPLEYQAYLEQKLRYEWAEEERIKNAAVLKKLHEQSSGFGIGRGPDYSVKQLTVQDNAIVVRCSSEESNLAYEHIRYMFHIEKSESEKKMAYHKNLQENLKKSLLDNSTLPTDDDKLLNEPSNESEVTQMAVVCSTNESTEKKSQLRPGRFPQKVTAKQAQISKNAGKLHETKGKTEMQAKRTATPTFMSTKSATFNRGAPREILSNKSDVKMPKDLKHMVTARGNSQTGTKGTVGQHQSIRKGIATPRGKGTMSARSEVAGKVNSGTLKEPFKSKIRIPLYLQRERTVDIKVSRIGNSVNTKAVPVAQTKNQLLKRNAGGQNKPSIIGKASTKTVGSEFKETGKGTTIINDKEQERTESEVGLVSQGNLEIQAPSRIPVLFKVEHNEKNECGKWESAKEQAQTEILVDKDESGSPAMSTNQKLPLSDEKPKIATLLKKPNLPIIKQKNPINHSPAIVAKWNYQNPKRETKIGYNNPKSVVPLKKDERDKHIKISGTDGTVQQYHTPRGEFEPQHMKAGTPSGIPKLQKIKPIPKPQQMKPISKLPKPEAIPKQPHSLASKIPEKSFKPVPKTAISIVVKKQTAKIDSKRQVQSARTTSSSQNIKKTQALDGATCDTPRNSSYKTPRNTRYQSPRKSVLKDIKAKKDKP